MRIQLHPGLQLLQRGPGRVQIGLDGRHGTVLDGLTDADLALLHALETGMDARTLRGRLEPSPRAPAAATAAATAAAGPGRGAGVPLARGPGAAGEPDGVQAALRARILVKLLTEAGVLLRSRASRTAMRRLGGQRPRLTPDAVAWSLVHPSSGDGWNLLADRSRASVEIRGGGRTGLTLAATLAAAGVGDVRVIDPELTVPADLCPGGAAPADVGLPRHEAASRAVARALGGEQPPPAGAPAPPHLPRPCVVVLVDRGVADAAQADRLLGADLPHLSVVIRETSVIVGPFVVPGHGPCLRCLDLHRSDRDRQWPMILAQVLGRRHDRRAPREETALAQLAASLAALQVLGHLDGGSPPAAVGATLEVELPDGLISRRPWPAHASCGCHWPPPRGSRSAEQAVPASDAAPATYPGAPAPARGGRGAWSPAGVAAREPGQWPA